jgi:hypothetical protein
MMVSSTNLRWVGRGGTEGRKGGVVVGDYREGCRMLVAGLGGRGWLAGVYTGEWEWEK